MLLLVVIVCVRLVASDVVVAPLVVLAFEPLCLVVILRLLDRLTVGELSRSSTAGDDDVDEMDDEVEVVVVVAAPVAADGGVC